MRTLTIAVLMTMFASPNAIGGTGISDFIRIGVDAEVETSVTLDPYLMSFLENLPRELRIQFVTAANTALARFDETVLLAFDEAELLVDGTLRHTSAVINTAINQASFELNMLLLTTMDAWTCQVETALDTVFDETRKLLPFYANGFGLWKDRCERAVFPDGTDLGIHEKFDISECRIYSALNKELPTPGTIAKKYTKLQMAASDAYCVLKTKKAAEAQRFLRVRNHYGDLYRIYHSLDDECRSISECLEVMRGQVSEEIDAILGDDNKSPHHGALIESVFPTLDLDLDALEPEGGWIVLLSDAPDMEASSKDKVYDTNYSDDSDHHAKLSAELDVVVNGFLSETRTCDLECWDDRFLTLQQIRRRARSIRNSRLFENASRLNDEAFLVLGRAKDAAELAWRDAKVFGRASAIGGELITIDEKVKSAAILLENSFSLWTSRGVYARQQAFRAEEKTVRSLMHKAREKARYMLEDHGPRKMYLELKSGVYLTKGYWAKRAHHTDFWCLDKQDVSHLQGRTQFGADEIQKCELVWERSGSMPRPNYTCPPKEVRGCAKSGYCDSVGESCVSYKRNAGCLVGDEWLEWYRGRNRALGRKESISEICSDTQSPWVRK